MIALGTVLWYRESAAFGTVSEVGMKTRQGAVVRTKDCIDFMRCNPWEVIRSRGGAWRMLNKIGLDVVVRADEGPYLHLFREALLDCVERSPIPLGRWCEEG